MTKQSITVVRDWHPVRRAVAAGAMSVVLASAMALPAFAATQVDYSAGDTDYSKTEAFTDDANGISWDGKDAITLNNANLGDVDIEGTAVVTLTGESTVTGIGVDDGDLTLNGDVEVPAEEKPILNVVADEDDYDAGVYAFADDEGNGGNLTISGLTVNFDTAEAWVHGCNSVTIDNSKLAVKDVDNQMMEMYTDFSDGVGAIDIVESVVDAGTGGYIETQGVITINNSDVSVRAPKNYDYDSPYMGIMAGEDIKLISEANGEVKYYTNEYSGKTYAYVDTGDGNDVFLKAASTPGYYTGKQAEAKAMPKTGDAAGTAVAGLAAAAVAALGALGISRRRGQSEE